MKWFFFGSITRYLGRWTTNGAARSMRVVCAMRTLRRPHGGLAFVFALVIGADSDSGGPVTGWSPAFFMSACVRRGGAPEVYSRSPDCPVTTATCCCGTVAPRGLLARTIGHAILASRKWL